MRGPDCCCPYWPRSRSVLARASSRPTSSILRPASRCRWSTSKQYAQPQPQAAPSGRGLFNSRRRAPQVYAQQPHTYAQQPYVAQYGAPQYAARKGDQRGPQAGPMRGAYAYACGGQGQPAYTLDSGDKLRVVVFGQDGITNTYTVDAGGNISLPLVGIVPARGFSTRQLSQMIAERLKQGYVREPQSASRSKPTGRSSFSAKSPIPASILTSPT